MDASNIPEAVSLVGTLVDRVTDLRSMAGAIILADLSSDLGIDEDELRLKLKSATELIEAELGQP